MTAPTIDPQAAADLDEVMDGWYGCAQQATVFLSEAVVAGESLSAARHSAQVRYNADPARTSTVWRDEMPAVEALDTAADFLRMLTEGEWNTLTLDDYLFDGDMGGALRAAVPTRDLIVSARLVLAAAEHRTTA